MMVTWTTTSNEHRYPLLFRPKRAKQAWRLFIAPKASEEGVCILADMVWGVILTVLVVCVVTVMLLI